MTKRKKPIKVMENPCASCPYRKDTPPGVWHPDEYAKLKKWDGDGPEEMNQAVFMCHSANLAEKEMACAGWFETSMNNLGVRLNMIIGKLIPNSEPTKIPLYKSGAAACVAGMKGVPEPTMAAIKVMDKITTAKSLKQKAGAKRRGSR